MLVQEQVLGLESKSESKLNKNESPSLSFEKVPVKFKLFQFSTLAASLIVLVALI